MTHLEFSFEPSAWELMLERLHKGDSISAAKLLALLEDAEESELEKAFSDLQEMQVTLDISDLPLISVDGEISQRLQMESKFSSTEEMLSSLEENDPLHLYLSELAGIPAAGDAQLLAEKVAAGDEAAVGNLVSLFLGRVVELSREYTKRGVLLLDLIQEGSLGLWQGLQCYQSGDIFAYCDWWIRQYMAGAVTLQAKISGLGQKIRRGVEDFKNADQQLLVDLGRNPTLEEVAAYLHITPDEAAGLEETLLAARTLYRAKEKPQDAPQEETTAVEDTAYFQMRQRIEELLSSLEPEDAQILTLRYGLEGGQTKTAQQVASMLGITAQQVTDREAAALMKLRERK